MVVTSLSNQQREGASVMLDLDRVIPIRGMSKSETLRVQQKHVADRIRVFVKTDIFRQIKFINSDAIFQKAITLVMDHENVPQNWLGQYQSINESTFNDALNTERSLCKKFGGRIVRDSLAIFMESGSIKQQTLLKKCSINFYVTKIQYNVCMSNLCLMCTFVC